MNLWASTSWMIVMGEKQPGVLIIPPPFMPRCCHGGATAGGTLVLRDADVRPGETG